MVGQFAGGKGDGWMGVFGGGARGLLQLAVLSLIWGVNFPLMKIALAEIPPWTFRAFSSAVGGLALLAVAAAMRQHLWPRGWEWAKAAAVGLINMMLWQATLTYAMPHVPNSHAALVAYTMPLWVVVMDLVMGARLRRDIAIALVAGTSGIVLLLVRGSGPVLGEFSAPQLALFIGPVIWALGTQLQKRCSWQLGPLALAGWQLVAAAVPFTLLMAALEGPATGHYSAPAWGSWLFMAVGVQAFGYWAWYRLIQTTSAQVAALTLMLVPLVGVVSGIVVLGEAISWHEVAAGIAILTGLYFTSKARD
jgi:drug/metabolite transporter (DMT)-like permease